MPAVIACPKCKTKYQLPDSLLGKPIKCKSCGAAFQTKAPATPAKATAPQPKTPSGPAQPSASELSRFGLDGPLRRQPDVFAGAAPMPRKGPDMLGNLAADPGFANVGYEKEVEEESKTPDDLAEILQNPYLAPSAGGSKSAKAKQQYGAGDPNYTYSAVKLFVILMMIGVALESATWIGMSTIGTLYVHSGAAVEALEQQPLDDEATEDELTAQEQELLTQVLYFVGMVLILLAVALAIQLFTAVMLWIFMYKANCNVRALGATELAISPGWSIGWWFIPFMNLWKPVQSMSEIYRASMPPKNTAWKKLPEPGKVGLWWVCYILANVASGFQNRVENPILIEVCNWGGTVLHVVAGILLVLLALDISRKQEEHAAAKFGR